MEKYKNGVKAGYLPVLFLYSETENQKENHELREKKTFRSSLLNSNLLTNKLSERSFLQSSEAHDISGERK